MRNLRRTAVLCAVLAGLGIHVGDAGAGPMWAPAATASVHPGVQTFTAGAQCTANFVFTDRTNVYIGQAAHCSGIGGSRETNGCTSPSLPLGTPVTVAGASRPAVMVYNSWLTMQALGETNLAACLYNDLALLRLDPSDAAKVNPSIPFWGGPVGLNTTGTGVVQPVYSFGSSELRLNLGLLSPKAGLSLGDEAGGWSHVVSTITPGIPGDSGSAFLDAQGRAVGVLSTIQLGLPGVLTNGVGDLARELAYLRARTALTGVVLALGTTPFSGNRLPLGLG